MAAVDTRHSHMNTVHRSLHCPVLCKVYADPPRCRRSASVTALLDRDRVEQSQFVSEKTFCKLLNHKWIAAIHQL